MAFFSFWGFRQPKRKVSELQEFHQPGSLRTADPLAQFRATRVAGWAERQNDELAQQDNQVRSVPATAGLTIPDPVSAAPDGDVPASVPKGT